LNQYTVALVEVSAVTYRPTMEMECRVTVYVIVPTENIFLRFKTPVPILYDLAGSWERNEQVGQPYQPWDS